jgi:hypothetical protein
MTDVLKRHAAILYDSANSLVGADANTSNIMTAPEWLGVSGLAAGTTVSVQVRLHPNGDWHEFSNIDGATDVKALIDLEGRFNYVRTVRTGPADLIVVAQQ